MFWPQLTTRYLERKEQGRGEVSVSFPVVQQPKELPTMALIKCNSVECMIIYLFPEIEIH